MPKDFKFTSTEFGVVGGQFRKPVLIKPDDIARSVDEAVFGNTHSLKQQ